MPANPDHKRISKRLYRLIAPFDRQMEWANTTLAAALVAVIPATFLTLWLILDTGAKRAFGWSAGLFGIVVIVGILWDGLIARLLLRRFDKEFPRTDPVRELAVRLLVENRLNTQAEERLLNLLGKQTRLASTSPLPSSDYSHLGASNGPAIDPVPPSRLQVPVLWTGPQKGSTYNYIPLEPRVPPRDSTESE